MNVTISRTLAEKDVWQLIFKYGPSYVYMLKGRKVITRNWLFASE